MQDRIYAFVMEQLAPRRGVTQLARDESLIDTGIVDSLGIFQLMAFLEEEFAISIADDEVTPDNFRTLAAIEAFVEAKQARAIAG
jgi:acyl carrier protein